MRRHQNDATAVVDAPSRGRRDAIIVPNRLDGSDLEVAKGLDTAEVGVVDVHADLGWILEAVSAFRLQPIGVECLNGLVRVREVVLENLILRDDGAIRLRAPGRLVRGAAASGERNREGDEGGRRKSSERGSH